MGRRVLAFFLGMIFGIIFLIGGLGLGVYLAVTTIKPSDITAEASDFIGDFADMSIMDMVNSVQALYLEKAGVAHDGKYYSLGEFLENYNIDTKKAFGIALPQSLLDIPLFEYFQEGGVDRALSQISLASIPDFLNLFVTSEDGSAYVNDETVEKLSHYSIKDLIDEDKGISYVFADIRFVDVLPDAFPAESSANVLMWAVGQSSIGKLFKALNSSDNMFLQVKEGGALEALGQLAVTDILGEADDLLVTLLGGINVQDLIDENGNVVFEDLINDLRLGSLLGYSRKEIENIEDFDSVVNNAIYQKGDTFAAKDGDDYYRAELTCAKSDCTHNTADCYNFVWYDNADTTATGLYKALANIAISDLLNGGEDKILDKIKNVKISEIVNGDITGILSGFADMTINQLLNGGIDDLYLGTFLGYDRIKTAAPTSPIKGPTFSLGIVGTSIAMSDNDGNWYKAERVCTDETCTHTSRDCYRYVWENDSGNKPSSLMWRLSDKKVDELNDVTDMLMDCTISELIDGEITGALAEFADMTIRELKDGDFNDIYLGFFLAYERTKANAPTAYDEIETSSGSKETFFVGTVDGQLVISDDGKDWYNAKHVCTDADHTCDRDCYRYVWKDGSAEPSNLMCKLADKKIADLDNVTDLLMSCTLNELIDGEITGVLAEFADMTIDELVHDGIDNKYLGTFLGYDRIKTTAAPSTFEPIADGENEFYVGEIDTQLVMSDDGDTWYNAKLVCTDASHTHTRDCYRYVWMDGGSEADKLMSKFADTKICDLNDINDLLMSCTIEELIDGEITGVLTGFSDMTIEELMNGGIDDMYLGIFLSYDRIEANVPTTFDELTDGENKFYVGEIDTQLVMSDDGDTWYNAKLVCTDTTHATHTRDCYRYVWMDGETEADNLMSKFADTKISGLDDLNDKIMSCTLGDVMGDNLSGFLLELKDTPINQISDKVYDLYLGSAIGYYRKSVAADYTDGTNIAKSDDGTTWYEAELDCTNTDATHTTHTADCYAYVWYTDEGCTTPVDGLNKAFVNSKLNNIDDTIDNLTLRKLGIGGNNILDSLADTPITELDTAMDVIKIGTVFGYDRISASAPETFEPITNGEDSEIKFYIGEIDTQLVMSDEGEEWYNARLTCNNTDTAHTHNNTCYHYVWMDGTETVVGINAKMSDKTLSELSSGNGIADIVEEFTVREMQESGLLELSDQEEYKLDIIFDDSVGGCTLAGYITAKAAAATYGSTLTAEDYYKDVHGTDNSYRGKWKDYEMSYLIASLLGKI